MNAEHCRSRGCCIRLRKLTSPYWQVDTTHTREVIQLQERGQRRRRRAAALVGPENGSVLRPSFGLGSGSLRDGGGPRERGPCNFSLKRMRAK